MPQFGGLDCIGDIEETAICNDIPCPIGETLQLKFIDMYYCKALFTRDIMTDNFAIKRHFEP